MAEKETITSFDDVEPTIKDEEFYNPGGGEDEPPEPKAPVIPEGVEVGKSLPEGFKADELPDNLMVGEDGMVAERPVEKPPEAKEGDTRETAGKQEIFKEGKWVEAPPDGPGTWKDGEKEYSPEELREALEAKKRISGMLSAHMKRTNELAKTRNALGATREMVETLKDGALDSNGSIDPGSTAGELLDALREQGKTKVADALEKAIKAPAIDDFEDPRDKELERLQSELQQLKLQEKVSKMWDSFKTTNKLSAEEMTEIEDIGAEFFLRQCPKDSEGNPDIESGLKMNIRTMPLDEGLEMLRGKQAIRKLEAATKNKAKEPPENQPPQKKHGAGTQKHALKSFGDITLDKYPDEAFHE